MFRASFMLLGLMAMTPCRTLADDSSPPELTPEQQNLLATCAKHLEEGSRFCHRGQYVEAIDRYQQALAECRKAFPESKYPDGTPDLASCLNDLGFALGSAGQIEKAIQFTRQSLEMRRKLCPPSRYPNGHVAVAQSLNNMAYMFQASGDLSQALSCFEESLAIYRKIYPPSKYPDGHGDVALSLNNLGDLLQTQGSYARAQTCFEESLAIYRKLYPESRFPNGAPYLAMSLNNMGLLHRYQGALAQSLTYYEESLGMYRKLYPKSKYPDGHPALALSLDNTAATLQDLGDLAHALPYFEEAVAIYMKFYPKSKYPDGHPDLALSLSYLGTALRAQGAFARAEVYLEQALAMHRKIYSPSISPDGHPMLANNLINLGRVSWALGKLAPAQDYFEQALAMDQKLFPKSKYPNGHPELAECLNNLAAFSQVQGQFERAKSCYDRALEMYRKRFTEAKYPDGHPEIARTLNNLASLCQAQGDLAQSQSLFGQSLAMVRRLYPESKYPEGHPDLANAYHSLAAIHRVKREYAQARDDYKKSLDMYRKIMERRLLLSSEADCLALMQSQPHPRDGYLSAAAHLPDPESDAYGQVWDSKAIVTRLLEIRHAQARAAGGDAAKQLDQLRDNRRRTERLLQDRRLAAPERDKQLASLADERDRLERDLARTSPVIEQWKRRFRLTPDDLSHVLPDGVVFIDLLEYTRFEQAPTDEAKTIEQRTRSYTAFALTRGAQARRVELGPTEPIDHAIHDWRQAIEQRAIDSAAERLKSLVWAPLAKLIPQGTRTIYLAPDGDLARMPWAALPVGSDQVLLERFAVAQVPHGPYLLEALTHPRQFSGPESILAIGGVDYGASAWPALPGTEFEVSAISTSSPIALTTLSKSEATAARLTQLLRNARYAHLATHGEFQSEQLGAEKKRALEAVSSHRFGDDSRTAGLRNPLGFVGLVLANGERLSGLSLVDLPLENLKLVTLSACETGLGDYTGGEGVQGLQRAFHLAGCENVVASLWKINDAASAALMAKFYHELWINKKTPIDALREAQLTIYRHPELIPDLSGERGVPKLKDAAAAKMNREPAGHRGKTADTKLWAAFVLSGAGQ